MIENLVYFEVIHVKQRLQQEDRTFRLLGDLRCVRDKKEFIKINQRQ